MKQTRLSPWEIPSRGCAAFLPPLSAGNRTPRQRKGTYGCSGTLSFFGTETNRLGPGEHGEKGGQRDAKLPNAVVGVQSGGGVFSNATAAAEEHVARGRVENGQHLGRDLDSRIDRILMRTDVSYHRGALFLLLTGWGLRRGIYRYNSPNVYWYVCIFFSFILDVRLCWTYQPGSHRISHPLSFCGALALIFLAIRVQPFLSLVDRKIEFCVLAI